MEPQTAISGHIVLLAFPAWGHLRPICSFGCKLVQERPDVSVSLLTAGDFVPRLEGEISRYLSTSEADTRARANIRIVKLGGEGHDLFTLLAAYVAGFSGYFDKVLKGEAVQCAVTQKMFISSRPTAVVLDFFLTDIFRQVRSVTGKHIPAYIWDSLFASSSLRLFGSERLGGFGNTAAKARKVVEATGRKMEDVLDEIYHVLPGDIVNVPGLCPAYDYETYSQEPTPELNDLQNRLWSEAAIFYEECDGIISISSSSYEGECIARMKSFFGETDRPVYAIGPLFLPKLSEASELQEVESSDTGKTTLAFLDKILKNHGERSLIYVSFGTVWWPRKNEHVCLMVDVLLDLKIPFVFSQASPIAVVPPEYHEKVSQSGIGMITKWAPQQTLLSHPITGWMVTHCGQNSVTEAMTQGIPIIAWPLDADQPINASYLSLKLDVAFELLEVRTGNGLRPLHRGARPKGTREAVDAELRDVLKRAFGPEGERKRRNAQAVREGYIREWEEGGGALRDLREFLSDHCGRKMCKR